ncbi:Pyruvate phosphate dikinase, PEP/pyruvate binding domain [Saccharicrinis carchari]|uniref:Phosphoenolpyruvate synthase n=1 Tax=Saccharicrinis carchari TaxID=1168039 RepID=A0A521EKC7_SACCC|nr:PEP/pyruvate-binding domain-containing protein [Saccharicrinis carchari]SMO84366.1 Pyruvate phosphate dikinase, PEP/pyruvate binding domain [Saccharicrinis carchari]
MGNEKEQTLSQVYKRKKSDQDIFPELMEYKAKEVLLIANHYDAYSIVREGRFFDRIYGEFLQLNLFTAPRITSASNGDEAMELMEKRHFDMVILMAGLDKKTPVAISKKIKQKVPKMPLLAMVNNNSDLRFFDESGPNVKYIDKVFVWNGDSKVFLAMIKYVEDKMNADKDTKIGDVRIILLVEDSQKYYTRYLPLLYSIIMKQTQAVLAEEGYDQLHKILKMRARPKVLLVSNYEDAIEIVEKYREYLICVISDVKYNRNGVPDEDAGVDLIRYVKSKTSLPALLQSSDPCNAERAKAIGADFIDKNSESLSQDIYDFIHVKLGFGNFVFKNSRGMTVSVARNLKEFNECIKTVSAESLLYHAKRNGISTWLMARGEINMAKRLRPYKIEDFDSSNKLRQAILRVFEQVKLKRLRGRVVLFESSLINSNRYITRIGEGSFGGKGRGLAFLCHFVENIDFKKILPDLAIRIPTTAIVGADEFSEFIERNNLYRQIYVEQKYDSVRELFIRATFTDKLKNKLRKYVSVINEPLAVRSSGLFEDSLLQPFAGVYETFMLPNNHPDIEVRLEHLITAIKLVYASIFRPSARAYFEAVNYKIEEEKMAVIIQKIVGETAHNRFYPHISGIAQSYNYYPFSYMKPEDGFAVLGVGLGKYVVGGEKAWRFCPKFPNLELNSIQDQVKDSQSYFYALDLEVNEYDIKKLNEDSFIRKLPMKEAEEDGNLRYCASVYDYNYDRITNNLDAKGPRIVNFANILKYDYIPLSKSLELLLKFFKEAMGAPVEIEFAVDLNPENHLPTLYLLQIKPLIRLENNAKIDFTKVDTAKVILASEKGMGNGRIEHIKDVIFMAPEKFNRIQTNEMASEIALLNKKMEQDSKEYLLIGPGRWGTRDKYTGIPVLWSQISYAKVIVEMGLQDFPLEASLGSHFFHNVTSMNVGYFSIHHNQTDEYVNFEVLKKQRIVGQTAHFTHVEFEEPLQILMDGEKQKAMVSWL